MLICDNDNVIASYDAKRSWGCSPTLTQKTFKPEILSPASSETYKSAVYNGADAIYFGYKELNARAGGDNFSSIKEVVDFCHLYNVKTYLALNIELKNKELDLAKDIIIEAENAKIDAFIISDLSLIPLIRKYSKAQLHASTQMGVHNLLGAKYLEKLGFDRVVLSREVTLEEIADIKKNCAIEVELFVHGALCVGFSGSCLMSSMITCCSGNRGRCSQLCRQYYTSFIDNKKVKEGYLLSAKDINMLEYLDKLKQLKVDSYKIEGRLRKSEYVGGVTAKYQFYNSNNAIPTKADVSELKKLFNRGDYTTAYLGNKDIIYPYIQSHIGLPCGKIIAVQSADTAIMEASFDLVKNDGFKITRNKLQIAGGVITGVNGNKKYILHTDSAVNVGDTVNITTDNALKEKIDSVIKKVKADIGIRFVANEKPHIIASANNSTVEIYGEQLIPVAITNPMKAEDIKEQFSKTGETCFEFNFVNVVSSNAFMNKAWINALRRNTIEKLQIAILEDYERKPQTLVKAVSSAIKEPLTGDFCEVDDSKALSKEVTDSIKNIVYCPDVLEVSNCKAFYEKIKSNDNLIFIKPPIFVLDKNIELLTQICNLFDGIVANNYGLIELAEILNKKVVACYNLNITNNKNPLIKTCDQYIVSTELNLKELNSFKGALLYTYGNLPLMYLNHCPRKLSGMTCGQCDGDLVYKDQKGEYPVVTQKFNGYCLHTLKNGIVTNLGNIPKFAKYFDFSGMEVSKINNVIYQYYTLKEFNVDNYNHLHLSREVY